jgi:ketol-acid reductoisomerase
MKNVDTKIILNSNGVDNAILIAVNKSTRKRPTEEVGAWLRENP